MLLRILLLLVIASHAIAQKDSSHWLKEVRVADSRLSAVNNTVRHDSLEITPALKLSAGNLAAQLEREAGLFIRNYGNGNLSSVSLRGTGSSQTAVLWNGLQVQSPMLGIYDLTLIPSFLTGTTEIRYGGCSPSTGSGAMGGALLLNSEATIQKGYDAILFGGFGEYGHLQTGVSVNAGSTGFASSTRVYLQQSENNFRYTDPEQQAVQQSNAAFSQAGAAQDLRWEGKSGRVDVHGWFLKNEREIPPHMLTTSSKQNQEDESIRLSASWKFKRNRWDYFISAGWSREEILYRDPAAYLDELSSAIIFQPEAQVKYEVTPVLSLMAVAGTIFSKAEVEYYDGTKSSAQYTLSTAANYTNNNWDLQAIVRGGVFNGTALPLLPSVSVYHYAERWPSFRFEASSVYRNPTLNDLYWQPGGNENLKPESGYSLSASLEKTISKTRLYTKITGGVFYTEIQDLLTWIPGANGVYSPVNMNLVESKGLEGNLHLRTCFPGLNFRFTLTGQYNPAILKEAGSGYEQGVNQQLIYTPKVMVKGNAEILFKDFSLRYFHSYTGYRYVTIDHAYYLEPFATGELLLSWNRKFRKFEFTAYGNLKNCWDEAYQVIALRAMPGRYVESGIIVKFSK